MQCFYPVESLANAQQISFVLPRYLGPNCYLPQKLLLRLDVKLNMEGADTIPNAKKVAPINNTLHSFFKACRIFLGETLITKNANNYAFKSYMIDLLTKDSNAKYSWMRAQMWHKDTFGHTLETQTDLKINAGFKSRMNRFKNEDQSAYVNHTIPIMGRLHTDLGSTQAALCPGLGIKVELELSSNDFLLQSAANDTSKYYFVVDRAVLYCPVAQISEAMYQKIEKKLTEKDIYMYFHRTEVTTKSVPANTEVFTEQLFPGGPLPVKVVLALLPTASYLGSQHTNPFFFARRFTKATGSERPGVISSLTGRQGQGDTTFIEHVELLLNGESLDGLDDGRVTATEDLANFIRLHYDMGFMESRTGNSFDYEDFRNGFYFLFYDLSTGGQATDEYVVPGVRQGNLRLQMHFSSPLNPETTSTRRRLGRALLR